jgi:hypothetical protein
MNRHSLNDSVLDRGRHLVTMSAWLWAAPLIGVSLICAPWNFTGTTTLGAQPPVVQPPAAQTPNTDATAVENPTSGVPNGAVPQTKTQTEEEPPEEEKLPKLDALEWPDAATLLRKPPVDWVILKSDEVVVVEPLEPRPGALEKQTNLQLEAMRKPLPPQKEAMELEQARRRELGTLKITIADPNDPEPEYRIEIKLIREILYHEDLILRRVDQLLQAKETSVAYELLSELADIAPGWRGSRERMIELLRVEANLAIEADNFPRARVRLFRLLELDAASQREQQQLLMLTRREIEQAQAAGDPRLAWEILNSVPASLKPLPEWQELRGTLLESLKPLLDQDQTAPVAWRPWQKLIDARRTAPDLPELKSRWREQARRSPLLRIVRTPDGRETLSDLTRTRLFERTTTLASREPSRGVANGQAHVAWTSPILKSWEPTDLGRRERLTLTSSALEAGWSADQLAEWLDQTRRDSSTTLSQFLDGYRVLSPSELVIDLRSPPRSFEALFFDAPPLTRQNAATTSWERVALESFSGETATPHEHSPGSESKSGETGAPADPAANRLSAWRRETDAPGTTSEGFPVVVLQRTAGLLSQGSRTTSQPLHWLREVRVDSEAVAVRDLLRGDADWITVIDPQDLMRFRRDSRFFVIPYAAPSVVALRWATNSDLGRNANFRRALSLCVQREKSADVVAGTDVRSVVQPAARFFGRKESSSASLLGDQALEFDPVTAATFLSLARKELGNKDRPLRMEQPTSDVTRRCQAVLLETLNRLGLATEVVPVGSELADVRWERMVIGDPVLDWPQQLHPTVSTSAGSRWNLLDRGDSESESALRNSPWERVAPSLRFLATELQAAGSQKSALELATRLEHEVRLAGWLVPVVEIQDHAVGTKRLSRLPAEFVQPFDGIAEWRILPEEDGP